MNTPLVNTVHIHSSHVVFLFASMRSPPLTFSLCDQAKKPFYGMGLWNGSSESMEWGENHESPRFCIEIMVLPYRVLLRLL
jgi:hypothetical protein